MKESNIPFVFDRNSRSGLALQLADGFRRAIRDGIYHAGETLPTIRELSGLLSVGEITVRSAMKHLTAEGLISPRRGIGAVVTGSSGKLNRGRILLVTTELTPNFSHSVMLGALRKRMVAEGYLPLQVAVERDASGKLDCSQLDQLIGEAVSLAVVFGSHWGVWSHVERSGVPTLVLGSRGRHHVAFDGTEALPEFIDRCRGAGVKSIVLPLTPGANGKHYERLRDAGFHVEKWSIRHDRASDTLAERVFRGSFNFFVKRFEGGRFDFPDVFLFIDDFVAAGALYAMDILGVRIPEDVGVVTWCARGSGPFYRKKLSRFEMDPKEGGRILVRQALALLSGRSPPKEVLSTRYCPGETFVADL